MAHHPPQSLTTPLVSILMLTYNRASYIKEAIDSVRAQTYSHWELIIIDDGSTDATPDIINTYHDPRIRYIAHTQNAGINTRRKESLREAEGAYVAILDSDDLWNDPTKLAQQVTFLNTHPTCAVVGTFIHTIDAQGHSVGNTKYGTRDSDIRSRILIRNQFAHSSVLMRKTMLDATEGYRPTLAEDLELFLQLGRVGTFANIPKCLTTYRIHTGGASAHKLRMAKAVHRIIKTYKDHYPNYLKARIFSYIRLLLAQIRT